MHAGMAPRSGNSGQANDKGQVHRDLSGWLLVGLHMSTPGELLFWVEVACVSAGE